MSTKTQHKFWFCELPEFAGQVMGTNDTV